MCVLKSEEYLSKAQNNILVKLKLQLHNILVLALDTCVCVCVCVCVCACACACVCSYLLLTLNASNGQSIIMPSNCKITLTPYPPGATHQISYSANRIIRLCMLLICPCMAIHACIQLASYEWNHRVDALRKIIIK